jgi:dephospho-CoA kinase
VSGTVREPGALRPLLRVGLTGGIASGKTTIGRIFAEHGALVLDADLLAREAMAPGGAAHDAVVAHFGGGILDGRGRVDRARLGALVFGDAVARAALEAIVHPTVLGAAERRIADDDGHSPIAVLDAALLVETGAWRRFHKLVVARCSVETQLRRLLARGGLSTAEAQFRIDAQAPLPDKLAVADYVVDTDGTLRDTRRQVDAIYAALLRDFEERFGAPGVPAR